MANEIDDMGDTTKRLRSCTRKIRFDLVLLAACVVATSLIGYRRLGWCTEPTTSGYNFQAVAGGLTIANFEPNGVVCAHGYTGTVSYAVCSSAGTAYSVSGCRAVCAVPTQIGYNFVSVGGIITIEDFAPNGVACADGYAGSVMYAVCEKPGAAYSVMGCNPTCILPNTAGYNFQSAAGSITLSKFAPNGVACADGYSGDVSYTVCKGAGEEYSVSGCQPTCRLPKAIGYDFTSAAGSVTIANFAPFGVICAHGYIGAVSYTVCDAAGAEYSVDGCRALCALPTTTGYDFTSASGIVTIADFAPAGVVCAVGYIGAVSYTTCKAPGEEYSVSGCQAACVMPGTKGYDFNSAAGSVTMVDFAPIGVTCAAGYTGTVHYTVCKSSGEEYSVSGCVPEGLENCDWTCYVDRYGDLRGMDLKTAADHFINDGKKEGRDCECPPKCALPPEQNSEVGLPLDAMPRLGFGTCCRPNANGPPLEQSILKYLSLGGRLIDTALMYGNHESVGKAIRKSHVPRHQIWITTKVMGYQLARSGDDFWVKIGNPAAYVGPDRIADLSPAEITARTVSVVKSSLEKLCVDYVDLLEIHNPTPEAGVDDAIWAGLIALKKSGLAKHVGVSNFGRDFVEKINQVDQTTPCEVLQTHYYPWSPAEQRAYVKWCLDQGIRVTAIGSLGGSKDRLGSDNKPIPSSVKRLSEQYNATAGQIFLRWALDTGVDVIPGSDNHIQENLQLEFFTLSQEEILRITKEAESETRQWYAQR